MTKYHDNSKSYNAIVEAMQQIRYNALVEEYGEDEMEEAYMYEAEDEEEMAEMSGEEEEAVAQMMDEALYEMDMDDDEDNLNEADDDRKARRRKRLRQALLIGAGLAAGGLATAPLAFAGKNVQYAGAPKGGEGLLGGSLRRAGNLGTRYMSGVGNLGTAAGTAYQAGREKVGDLDVSGLSGLIPKFGKKNP